jgi:hypothetical protein
MVAAIEDTNTKRKSAEIEISSKNPQIFFPFFHKKRREKTAGKIQPKDQT